MRSLVIAFVLANHHHGQAFVQLDRKVRAPRLTPFTAARSTHPLKAIQQEEEVITEAVRLKKEAQVMRLQAEKMDLTLTLQKIEKLEKQLQNKTWLAKHPEQEAELQAQLQRLNDKLKGKEPSPRPKVIESSSTAQTKESISTPSSSIADGEKKRSALEPKASKSKIFPGVPLAGFDECDLDLYIPVALDINQMMPNGTIAEKLECFRTAPELQDHFQEKIRKMLVGPLEEMQRLEDLKKEYLDSTSTNEREQLKREIDRIEDSLEEDGPFMYSEGFYCEDLPPMTEEDIALRMEAVGALPDMLIAIYKQRNNLEEDADLRLAIQMDYYEPQLQLLEQARMIDPLTDDMREQYVEGFNSLPKPVQERFAMKAGLDKDSDAKMVLEALLKDASPLSPMMQVVGASNAQADLPEYNDIEFVDRSRFLEEFFPSIGNMEGEHPSLDDVKKFSLEVLDKKYFMVTSKPERVAGGYYIRGTNLLSDDEDGTMTAADKLVAEVSKKMESSPLADELDFFYILDPSPPTDEEIQFGPTQKPIFVVTSKNREKLYKWASPLTKTGVTLAGLLTTFMFSVGSCALNPAIADRFYATLDSASTEGVLDLQWFTDLCFPMFLSLIGIQLAHEVAHRLVAWDYKFEIGTPNFIPSITTGLSGAITPLKSPPPNSKAMFDFGIAGPLAGLAVSLGLLLSGLEMTSSIGLGSQLPVVPVDLLRASSLGGGLVQYFLGNAAVMPDQGPAAVLQLHPLAIAGFIGCMTNSLALLPLGLTDGGRISLAMFGRRGAFVVKLFTTVLLCVAGLFGLDDVNIFLTYVLFATIWQRELETPARNEVDELDFPRGLLAIFAAIFVGLVLIPMV